MTSPWLGTDLAITLSPLENDMVMTSTCDLANHWIIWKVQSDFDYKSVTDSQNLRQSEWVTGPNLKRLVPLKMYLLLRSTYVDNILMAPVWKLIITTTQFWLYFSKCLFISETLTPVLGPGMLPNPRDKKIVFNI